MRRYTIPRLRRYTIPRLGARLLLPLILLFALYVQFHGDYGPGGGFQAGVIFGAGFILYALIYGLDNARRLVPPWLLRIGVSLGVLIYAGVGLMGLFLGGNFLDYGVLDTRYMASIWASCWWNWVSASPCRRS